MITEPRSTVLAQIVEAVMASDGQARRIAVDGPDAAGKTTIADELASLIGDHGAVAECVAAWIAEWSP